MENWAKIVKNQHPKRTVCINKTVANKFLDLTNYTTTEFVKSDLSNIDSLIGSSQNLTFVQCTLGPKIDLGQTEVGEFYKTSFEKSTNIRWAKNKTIINDCDLSPIASTIIQSKEVVFEKVKNMPKELDLKDVKIAKFMYCDIESIEKMNQPSTQVSFIGIQKFPVSELDFSKLEIADIKASSLHDIDKFKGAKVTNFFSISAMPETVDLSACKESSVINCSFDGCETIILPSVKDFKRENHAWLKYVKDNYSNIKIVHSQPELNPNILKRLKSIIK